MSDVTQGMVKRDSSTVVGSNGASGASSQGADAIERSPLDVKPWGGLHLQEQGTSGRVPAPASSALLAQPESLDLVNLTLPKLETALASLAKSAPSPNTLADASPMLHRASEQRAGSLREHFPFGKAAYDYYFSASGVIRDAFDLLTHGVGWMSGVSVAGTSLALFGLAPVPFFGGVAAGVGVYQAIQFMGRGLTGAIWGQDGLS